MKRAISEARVDLVCIVKDDHSFVNYILFLLVFWLGLDSQVMSGGSSSVARMKLTWLYPLFVLSNSENKENPSLGRPCIIYI